MPLCRLRMLALLAVLFGVGYLSENLDWLAMLEAPRAVRYALSWDREFMARSLAIAKIAHSRGSAKGFIFKYPQFSVNVLENQAEGCCVTWCELISLVALDHHIEFSQHIFADKLNPNISKKNLGHMVTVLTDNNQMWLQSDNELIKVRDMGEVLRLIGLAAADFWKGGCVERKDCQFKYGREEIDYALLFSGRSLDPVWARVFHQQAAKIMAIHSGDVWTYGQTSLRVLKARGEGTGPGSCVAWTKVVSEIALPRDVFFTQYLVSDKSGKASFEHQFTILKDKFGQLWIQDNNYLGRVASKERAFAFVAGRRIDGQWKLGLNVIREFRYTKEGLEKDSDE